jgi:hypothetical protein
MQRMNSLVVGLLAVFVLGGSLALLSCGGGDDTTDIDASNAQAQLGGKQFIFQQQTDFGNASGTLAFNGNASRFAFVAGNSVATGVVGYGDGTCIFTVGASTFQTGTGPQNGLVVTADPCQTDQDNNNNLILGDAESDFNGPTTITVP